MARPKRARHITAYTIRLGALTPAEALQRLRAKCEEDMAMFNKPKALRWHEVDYGSHILLERLFSFDQAQGV